MGWETMVNNNNGRPNFAVNGIPDLMRRQLHIPNIGAKNIKGGMLADTAVLTAMPKAIQGFQHDLTFAASSQTVITWTSGTIKFYDTTTQAVSSGSLTLSTGSVYYVYFDLADATPATLKNTTNYQGVMASKTGMMAVAQRGSAATINATIWPSFGKTPLVNADMIQLSGISYDSIGDGTTYKKVLSTDITAGRIILKSTTNTDGTVGLVAATDISSGHVKVTSLVDAYGNAYTPGKVTRIYYGAGFPSNPLVGDTCIVMNYPISGRETEYFWTGATWQITSTTIDGGSITTGVINAALVNIQNAASSPTVVINSSGISCHNGYTGIEVRNYYGGDAISGWIFGAGGGGVNNTFTLRGYSADIYLSSDNHIVYTNADLYPSSDNTYKSGLYNHRWSEVNALLLKSGASDLHLDANGGSNSVHVIGHLAPESTNTYWLGSSTQYWAYVYGGYYYGKGTSITAFHSKPDITMVRAIASKKVTVCDKKLVKVGEEDYTEEADGVKHTGKRPKFEAQDDLSTLREIETIDMDTLHPDLKSPDGQYINMGNFTSLALGAIRMQADLMDGMQRQIDDLTKRLEALEKKKP